MLKTVILMTEENPYGREYALRILENGGHIEAIVIESGTHRAKLYREVNESRLQGNYCPPLLAKVIEQHQIPCFLVSDHSGQACFDLIQNIRPDLIIFGGAGGKITRPLLSLAKHGCLNGHDGLLPECRGSSCIAWAIHDEKPIGASLFFVDEGLDTGPVLLDKEVPIEAGDTYERLESKILRCCGELVCKGIRLIEDGKYTIRHHEGGTLYKRMTPEILDKVKQKLANCHPSQKK